MAGAAAGVVLPVTPPTSVTYAANRARVCRRVRSTALVEWTCICSEVSYHASSRSLARLPRASRPRPQRTRPADASLDGGSRPGKQAFPSSNRLHGNPGAPPPSPTRRTRRPATGAAVAAAEDGVGAMAQQRRFTLTLTLALSHQGRGEQTRGRGDQTPLRAFRKGAVRRENGPVRRGRRRANCRSVPCSSPRPSNARWTRCATSRPRPSRSWSSSRC